MGRRYDCSFVSRALVLIVPSSCHRDSLDKKVNVPIQKPPTPPVMRRMNAQLMSEMKEPPANSRMLVRDFIHDSLYNPNYGYFSKKAHIFSLKEPIPFNSLRDNYAFMNHLADLYKVVENEPSVRNPSARQVWHTPTELFKPYYGYALAKYIVSEFKSDPKRATDLQIYEVGGGNGTLMTNILDWIEKEEPELYKRTTYVIIEISASLASIQQRQKGQRHQNYKVINQSIFEWKAVVESPCFLIAMEVIDNFSHDLVRYDATSEKPYQGVVIIEDDGDYREAYEPQQDQLISRFLKLRDDLGYKTPVLANPLLRRMRQALPFAGNLTKPEFLPTMNLLFLDTLKRNFPQHRLILSDFNQLPDTIEGHMAPVVQTRYQGGMVACSTYLVQPGWFDIFFPTDFSLLQQMYNSVCRGKQSDQDQTQVSPDDATPAKGSAIIMSQRDFLMKYADLPATRTRSGEYPMLSLYKNFSFLLS
ncbi:hypothetical protein HDU76_013477 [Blyttiomyces sp. JEL0837]|nr:hypothetical protein HDU76_013477 [Blyttiomyces sp. JEL0837]